MEQVAVWRAGQKPQPVRQAAEQVHAFVMHFARVAMGKQWRMEKPLPRWFEEVSA